MNRRGAKRMLVVGCVLVCTAFAGLAQGAEPAAEFLNGLRERGYYDMALEYLEQIKDSKLVAPEFRATILYEKGATLISASRTEGDLVQRGKRLDEARTALEEFIATQRTHHLVSSANGQLANLLVERARMNIDRANKKNTAAAEKTRLMEDARQKFDAAHAVFDKSKEEIKARLSRIKTPLNPNDPNDKKLMRIRDQYRADYLQARLLLPAIEEEKAATYPDGAKEQKELLEAAANNYKLVYEDYRRRIAGLYARMYQGRCQVKLNNYTEALSLFGDLLDQPDDPETFRTLKKKTLTLAVDCWLGDNEKALYNDAILRLGTMIEKVRPNEAKTPDWLYLRLALAKAYKAQADDLTKGREQTTSLNSAKNHAQFVTRHESPYKREAQAFLASLRGVELAPEEKPEPKTFAEARKAGKEALEDWQTAQITVTSLRQRIPKVTDMAEKQELTKQLQEAEKLYKESPGKSLGYFRLALEMADEETETKDMNVVRYFMAFWYFTLADYYDAALVGEFVARRYPDTPGASQCGQIAMASYVKIYKVNQSDDKRFEIDRITGIGDYIIDAWPNKPEAIVAANTLIAFAINDGKLDKAMEYLQRIPINSAERGVAELSTGQALWSSYLQGTNQLKEEGPPQGMTEDQEKTRLSELKNQSKKILADGIQRMRAKQLDETLLTAALSLAQIQVDTGEVDSAVTLLEDKDLGPLTFVKQKHPATQKPGFAIETYKTALRAYIASLKPGADNSAINAKAKSIMAALTASMGGTQDGKKKLIGIYINLANEIKKQLDIEPDLNRKRTLATGFASFLRELRSSADELEIHTWAAESFSKLGETFDTNSRGLSPDAKKFYEDAIKAFSTILERGKANPNWLSDDVKLQVQLRMASTKRRMGNFKEALDSFEQILRSKNSMLNVQVEAAMTYQQWAADPDPRRATLYKYAMIGARKDDRREVGGKPNKNYDKNTVWGWGKLAKITASYPQYRDIFHEARYNLALCRYSYALRSKNQAEQKKWKESAKRDIVMTQRLYPELGGAKWKPKYDRLIRDVQKSLGESVVGLPSTQKKKSGN